MCLKSNQLSWAPHDLDCDLSTHSMIDKANECSLALFSINPRARWMIPILESKQVLLDLITRLILDQ